MFITILINQMSAEKIESYSNVDAKEQLGIELSVNHDGDYSGLFQALLNGSTIPLDELN